MAYMINRLIRIRLATETEPPVTDRLRLLKFLSQCARCLPLATEEWDLSNLIINGQPVTRATIVAWLNCACQLIDSTDFEAPPAPAAPATAHDLYNLLVFADAVESVKGLVRFIALHYLDGDLVMQ
jgi:hypothetical protein